MLLSTAAEKVSAVVIMSKDGRYFYGFNKKRVAQTAWSLAGAKLFRADNVSDVLQRLPAERGWTLQVVALEDERAQQTALKAAQAEEAKGAAEYDAKITTSAVCKRNQRDRVLLLWQEALEKDDPVLAALCCAAVAGDDDAMRNAMATAMELDVARRALGAA